MEENLLSCLENFDVLWQRIRPAATPYTAGTPTDSQAGALAALLSELQSLPAAYRCLAGACSGQPRAALLHRGAQAAAQARRLAAEYFLLSGQCPRHSTADGLPEGYPARLRHLVRKELALAQALEQAAREGCDPLLSEALHCFAEAARQRARENRRLLTACF